MKVDTSLRDKAIEGRKKMERICKIKSELHFHMKRLGFKTIDDVWFKWMPIDYMVYCSINNSELTVTIDMGLRMYNEWAKTDSPLNRQLSCHERFTGGTWEIIVQPLDKFVHVA